MNLYQTVTDTIIEALARGVVPWRKPWSTASAIPISLATHKPYRGVNTFLLSLTPFQDHRWITFRQVQERNGAVRKGERSTTVIFWKFPDQEEAEERAERSTAPILRYYKVFNVEQWEGLSLPPIPAVPVYTDQQRIERADLLISGMADAPIIKEGGKAAWYSPSEDVVTVPKLQAFRSADAFYQTLFHELGHATGHPSRLNRSGVTGQIRFGSGEYSKEELVAELTSAFCCATIGLDNSLIEDSASYINGWLQVLRSDSKAIIIAAAQAQRAADYLRGVCFQ